MILNELHLHQIILHFLYCGAWFATSFLLLIMNFSEDTVASFRCLFTMSQVPAGNNDQFGDFMFSQLNMF